MEDEALHWQACLLAAPAGRGAPTVGCSENDKNSVIFKSVGGLRFLWYALTKWAVLERQ